MSDQGEEREHVDLPEVPAEPDNMLDGLILTEAQTAFLNELAEINGQDAYSTATAALGKMHVNEYLVLPTGVDLLIVAPDTVGSALEVPVVSVLNAAKIYALNKAAAPAGVDAIKFALLRLQAILQGWWAGQKEVRRVAAPTDSVATYLGDSGFISQFYAAAREAALVVPMVAEIVFRTTGHHYLSGNSAAYIAKYKKILDASLCSEVANYLPPDVLYHSALHWVSPERVRKVVTALKDNRDLVTILPDAIKLRYDAAPAGTALITTTAAVMEALDSSGLLAPLVEAINLPLGSVTEVAKVIRMNPDRYHKAYFAYGVRSPTTEELEAIENAKAVAAKFAPVAQGFITALLKEAALGQAIALKKHAEQNPVLQRRCVTFFRTIGRQKPTKVAELFTAEVLKGKVAEEEVE